MVKFEYMNGGNEDHTGFIPMFLHNLDPRPAREQFNERYSHGGGWRPLKGWKMHNECIKYPGDPVLRPIAKTLLNEETIYVYPHAWVAIVQGDGSYEVARLD